MQNNHSSLGDSSLPYGVCHPVTSLSAFLLSLGSFQHAHRAPEMTQECTAHLNRIKEKKEESKVPRALCTKIQYSLVSALPGCVG